MQVSEYKKGDIAKYDNLIADLQRKFAKLPQQEIPLKHNFAPGVYMREITIPKGTALIGKTHKTEHLNVVMQGECLVAMDGIVLRIVAPHTFKSFAGTKKVIYAIDDVVWSTVHPTEETDVDKLEALIIDQEAEMNIDKKEGVCLGWQ